MTTLNVYTDGGAKNNGKRSCTASWGVYFETDSMNLSEFSECGMINMDPSNQKAELYAIRKALEKLSHILQGKDVSKISSIQIVTDSQYSIDCLNKWYKNWEKNGWKTYKGDRVKHSTLIKECKLFMDEIRKTIDLKFTHVNSHMLPPVDKSSTEYRIWYGNYTVDKMVSSCLTNESAEISLPKGKVISIDWNGSVVSEEDDLKQEKIKRQKEDDRIINVSW